ncbi:MAG: phospholipid/glycerol acyltransferase, partial [uncultured bacterium]
MAEEQKKSKSMDHTAKIHLLPIKPRKTTKEAAPVSDSSNAETSDFSSLAERLEERIETIESDLRKSIQLLEEDFQKAIKNRKMVKDESLIRTELELLSRQLEARVQKTLTLLSVREEHSRAEKQKLDTVKKLTSQLIKILSFDFYKSVLDRLGNADYAEEVDPFGMDRHLVEKIKPIFDFMYYRYWRITTTGIEHIPNDGRGLIVANHSGTLPYDG